MLTPRQELARKTALFLRMRGKNPLPSREYDDQTPANDRKKQPIYKYAHLWEEAAPAEWFTPEGWPETQTIQCMTGRHWKLGVIDLDGPEAIEEWDRMGGFRCPRTWVSHSGGGGRHLWFTIPDGLPPLGQVFLWRGDGEHQNVEFLCDRRLIMTPPSIHPKTGREYKWLDVKHCPQAYGLGLPATMPNWVLDRVVKISQPKVFTQPKRSPIPAPHYASSDRLPSRDEILASVDKIGLAQQWGVRFTGRSRNGWHECRAFDHEDNNPSCAMHEDLGIYVDSSRSVRMSFFDLMINLGAGKDFKEVAQLLSGAR